MPEPKASDLDSRITFQAKGATRDPDSNTPLAGGWAAIAEGTVWAQVLDVRPSQDEGADDALNVASRRARIVVRYRSDITSAMRIVVWAGAEGEEPGEGDRVMQIVGGPAEIFGRRKWQELMAEEYSSAAGVAG